MILYVIFMKSCMKLVTTTFFSSSLGLEWEVCSVSGLVFLKFASPRQNYSELEDTFLKFWFSKTTFSYSPTLRPEINKDLQFKAPTVRFEWAVCSQGQNFFCQDTYHQTLERAKVFTCSNRCFPTCVVNWFYCTSQREYDFQKAEG